MLSPSPDPSNLQHRGICRSLAENSKEPEFCDLGDLGGWEGQRALRHRRRVWRDSWMQKPVLPGEALWPFTGAICQLVKWTPLSQHHSTWLQRDQSRTIGQHLPARRAWRWWRGCCLPRRWARAPQTLWCFPQPQRYQHLCACAASWGHMGKVCCRETAYGPTEQPGPTHQHEWQLPPNKAEVSGLHLVFHRS